MKKTTFCAKRQHFAQKRQHFAQKRQHFAQSIMMWKIPYILYPQLLRIFYAVMIHFIP
jgi:hypothetical protein